MNGGSPRSLPPRVDVVVVGGGIAGASTAYHLAVAGLDTVLIERDTIGGGATSASTGVLSPPIRQPFHETVRFRGQQPATEIWRFALRSVAGLSRLIEERGDVDRTGLDVRGGYVLAEPHTRHDLDGSFAALEAAGLPVSKLDANDVRSLTGGRGFTGGFRIDGLGAFRPGATTLTLVDAARDAGARIVERTPVESVRRREATIEVVTASGDIVARSVVYATHVDSGRFSDRLQREVVAIRGQGFRTRPLPHRFEGAFSTGWKLNVWRQDPDGSLFVSGWRHDAWERSYGDADSRVDGRLQGDLQRWFEAAFPDLAPLDVERRWGGLFGWTADLLPIVGPLPGRPGELVITGFSGGGLPFAFECGRVVAHAVTRGQPVEGADLFDPARFS